MKSVLIKDELSDIIIHYDKDIFYGYKFYDNKVEKIDINILKYFDFLVPSNNYTKLGLNNGYEVILDNNTNLKYYIKNGSFDYKMFFDNNGYDALVYNGDSNKHKTKTFLIRGLMGIGAFAITMELSYIYYLQTNINRLKENIARYEKEERKIIINDISTSYLYDQIYMSDIHSVYKKYLYNEELLTDILPFINESKYMQHLYVKKFNNLNISYYESDESNKNTGGYYDITYLNVINVNEEHDKLNLSMDDVIAHEFIHVLQHPGLEYSVLSEATAEIYSNEYFKNAPIKSYNIEVGMTKKLMELIGPEPIQKYIFLGDFFDIEYAIKPYLTVEEYSLFLNCLKHDYNDYNVNKVNSYNFDNLLAKVYKNKYNMDIKNDNIYDLIDNNSSLVRYYFNQRYMNSEYSYYYDINNSSKEEYSYEEAYNNGYIKFAMIKYDHDKKYLIDREGTYQEYLEQPNKYRVTRLYENCILDTNYKKVIMYELNKNYIPSINDKIINIRKL